MVGKLSKLPRIEMPSKFDSEKWIQDRVEKEGYRIDKAANQALRELAGDEIQQLEADLERLFILNLDSKKIDAPSVSEMVFQTREFGMFDLIPAMASKNTAKALSIIGAMFDSGMAVQQINWMLCWNYRRLVVARELLERRRPFFEIVRLLKMYSYQGKEKEIRKIPRRDFEKVLIGLRDADRLSKTTKGDPRGLLERLIVDTCRTDSV
jgi:DNA polymerase III delta subunit